MNVLYDELNNYGKSDYYPFHMPGHKRKMFINDFSNPFCIDITEIDGFDNLHHAEGIILSSEQKAAELYHSEETYFLVNGSTAGILSAISACTNMGDKILMARNCHKSAYHGVFLRNLDVEYVYPQNEPVLGLNGGLNPENIRQLLIRDKNIKMVFITSPTYDGVVSDVKTIADIVHEFQIPLVVDEAHGAHFGFHSLFPDNAIEAGADIVIHSLHKTLPSLTQTGLIHVNGRIVDRNKLRRYLAIYQTSSPSYVLMASIDRCIGVLSLQGDRLFEEYAFKLCALRERLGYLEFIKLGNNKLVGKSCIKALDFSKLILSVRGTSMTGKKLYDILRKEYHLQMEMASGNYVLAMTSIADTDSGFDRLCSALEDIELRYRGLFCNKIEKIQEEKVESTPFEGNGLIKNDIVMKISEAENHEMTTVEISKSSGMISGEYFYLYPPGIPIIVPGERISRNLIEMISYYKSCNLSIEGICDKDCLNIMVIKE